MPDLVTHSLVGYLAGFRLRSRRMLLWLVAGSILPDAASVSVLFAGRLGHRLLGDVVPAWIWNGSYAFHMPIPFALLCWFLVLWVPERQRPTLLPPLLLGGWLHLGLDYLQLHVGPDPYHPFYPATSWGWEAGWFWTETSLYAVPVLAVGACGVWLWRRS